MTYPTAYIDFVDGIEAISITGVNRTYQGRPENAPATADCPCQFTIFVGGSERSLVLGSQGGIRSLRTEFWIVIGPTAQNVGKVNRRNGVKMMDTVSTAIQNADCITAAHFEWDIDLVERNIAGIVYWTVVAVIRGSG